MNRISKLPTRQEMCVVTPFFKEGISKLLMRQETFIHGDKKQAVLSKLPTRQKTTSILHFRKSDISKLPVRQETQKNNVG